MALVLGVSLVGTALVFAIVSDVAAKRVRMPRYNDLFMDSGDTVVAVDGDLIPTNSITSNKAEGKRRLHDRFSDSKVAMVRVVVKNPQSKRLIEYEVFLHDLHWRLFTLLGLAFGWWAGLSVYPNAEAILTGKIAPESTAKAMSAAA